MRTIIAAAALAVAGAGTGVSAATNYNFEPFRANYDITFEVESASTDIDCAPEIPCEEAPEPPSTGDILTASFAATIESIDGDVVISRGSGNSAIFDIFPIFRVGSPSSSNSSISPYENFLQTGAGEYRFGEEFIGRLNVDLREGGSASYFSREGDGVGRIGTYTADLTVVDFTVTGFPVEGQPEVAPVPLPASAPLLALSLGGLAWWRRRAA